ncbi:hypothetical protein A2634_04970 [Candidatus Amesbacteria bacterium RIFCSPHIGHO2_01_FULL_48_32]|uniref:Methyltransferase type 11 domain-containing protein n=1 Tax=Candidatus Amesbacteria bacterium RIFCSPLOWO2_01_FULL_48_25 TaxID=1797259 RepID=A0A1F4ZCF9_9BACT|nr:MAG: hypothetical protein A2634_04970 [Candidatus Amesbacteria bacterium RIFCSPHIGHO2_01_FULL_48_32]OGD04020.1 MAG: hypothetical protein A2989_01320 [Candidatus Amesbacteria bacterium RIFCSPLOWO2_01_FULL_48_25]HJZ05716.1 class I SAM-dependent methyltransferase [Patescibacteria group bacterium]
MPSFLKQIKNLLVGRVQKNYPNWDITIALRYLPIVRDIQSRLPPSAEILEVGCGEFGILPYLSPKYKNFTGADVDFGVRSQGNRMRMVPYRGYTLPLPDRSFDVCICVDTLEHIPAQHRSHFMSELLRVTKARLYLTFPSGRMAASADSILASYYKANYGHDFPYLHEHQLYTLPQSSIVDSQISAAGWETSSQGNTNVILWVCLLFFGFSKFSFLTTAYILLAPLTNFFSLFNFPPYYRALIIASRHATTH